MSEENKPLYLWRLEDDMTLSCDPIREYNFRKYNYMAGRPEIIAFRDGRGKWRSIETKEIDTYAYGRVASYSNDYNYIRDIVGKHLFKRMLDTQVLYNKANERLIKFREMKNNGSNRLK